MSKKVIDALKALLADSYTLQLKTQNFHWNVTGSNFKELHLLFEEQYNDLAPAVDEVAERIRALGSKAPGSFKSFSKLSSVMEAEENISAKDMVTQLAKDQTIILKTLKKLADAANDADDDVTESLASDRMKIHEKNRWMLEATLEK